MENKFYEEDNFTQFLKDSTEDFKMYPNKRVWHSLYKDMHPSQKWPSFAVCLMLIGSIVYLGIINNNTINKNSTLTVSARKVPANSNLIAKQNNTDNRDKILTGQKTSRNSSSVSTYADVDGSQGTNIDVASSEMQAQNDQSDLTFLNHAGTYSVANSSNENSDKSKHSETTQRVGEDVKSEPTKASLAKIVTMKSSTEVISEEKEKSTAATAVLPSLLSLANSEQSFMDHDIFYNLKRNNVLKNRTSVHYYITPSVGFRTLKQKNIPANTIAVAAPVAIMTNTGNININDKVTQSYAINIEAGTGLNYNLTKRLSLTAGVQFNYTNYISYANSLQHSEEADLYIVSRGRGYEESRASLYANTVNGNYAVLNNTTIQFSIPVGLEYSVVQGRKIKWNVGATLQPGIIASGKGYALSSDNTHYIEDKSLLSNGLLNSSLQTTISYRTKNGVSIFAGPQLRYQLTDTHKSRYNYRERLYNYGFKLGLSRNL